MILDKTLPLLIALFLLSGCAKNDATTETSTAQDSVSTQSNQSAPPEKTEEEKWNESIAASSNLKELIDLTKPKMTDEFNKIPPASVILAMAMHEKNIKFDEIKKIETTKRGRILKDSFNELGKSLCVNGYIFEIRADRSTGAALYDVGILSNYTDVTRAIAFGSTGDLVEKSNARFCGVVVGKYSYSNSGGGTTHAPMLVGMFDLPENH